MASTPIHPGKILSDESEQIGLSAKKLADFIKVPPNRLHQLLAGKRNCLDRWQYASLRHPETGNRPGSTLSGRRCKLSLSRWASWNVQTKTSRSSKSINRKGSGESLPEAARVVKTGGRRHAHPRR